MSLFALSSSIISYYLWNTLIKTPRCEAVEKIKSNRLFITIGILLKFESFEKMDGLISNGFSLKFCSIMASSITANDKRDSWIKDE